VSATSLNAFKGRLDKYWDSCLSLDPDIFTKTIGEQPKGHLGLYSKAEEDVDDVVRIWSIARLTKRAAPLINLSIAHYMTNCAIFDQSRRALAIGLGLG